MVDSSSSSNSTTAKDNLPSLKLSIAPLYDAVSDGDGGGTKNKNDKNDKNNNSNRRGLLQICATIQARDLPVQQRAPVDILVALDVSNSMRGDKLDLCRTTLVQLLNALTREDRFGLVTWASEARTDIPVRNVTPTHKQSALTVLQNLQARNQTNLSSAIGQASQELHQLKRPNAVRTIFLLTDGIATDGFIEESILLDITQQCLIHHKTLQQVEAPTCTWMPKAKYHQPKFLDSPPLETTTDTSATTAITLHTFGYGKDHNAPLLRKLAATTHDGSYYFVDTDESVGAAFGDALGGVLSVVAQNVILNIKPELYTPRHRKVKVPLPPKKEIPINIPVKTKTEAPPSKGWVGAMPIKTVKNTKKKPLPPKPPKEEYEDKLSSWKCAADQETELHESSIPQNIRLSERKTKQLAPDVQQRLDELKKQKEEREKAHGSSSGAAPVVRRRSGRDMSPDVRQRLEEMKERRLSRELSPDVRRRLKEMEEMKLQKKKNKSKEVNKQQSTPSERPSRSRTPQKELLPPSTKNSTSTTKTGKDDEKKEETSTTPTKKSPPRLPPKGPSPSKLKEISPTKQDETKEKSPTKTSSASKGVSSSSSSPPLPPPTPKPHKIAKIYRESAEVEIQVNGSYNVTVGDFYAEETRDVLLEVELVPTLVKGNDDDDEMNGSELEEGKDDTIPIIPVVTASLRYTNTLRNEPMTTSKPVTCQIKRPTTTTTNTPNQKGPTRKENVHVQRQWLRISATLAMKEAQEAAGKGDLVKARSSITTWQSSAEPYCNSNNSDDGGGGASIADPMLQQLWQDMNEILQGLENSTIFAESGTKTLQTRYQTHVNQRSSDCSLERSNVYRSTAKTQFSELFSRKS